MRPLRLNSTIAAIVCLACLGCGESWQAATYPARGTVVVNGEPAAGAVVELHAKEAPVDERNSRPWAIVDEDGTYVLSTYEKDDGAPAGDYTVTVRWPPDANQPSFADRLNNAYVRPERSPWKVTVAEGENQLPNIEIEDNRVLSQEQTQLSGPASPGPGPG